VKFTVSCEWDADASVWYVSETDVPGLVAEAPTIEALDALLKDRVPELLQLNMPSLFEGAGAPDSYFDLLIHKAERVRRAAVA
jgi:hypothetical protein